MPLTGATDAVAPLAVEQRGTESLGFVQGQVSRIADRQAPGFCLVQQQSLCHLCCCAITRLSLMSLSHMTYKLLL